MLENRGPAPSHIHVPALDGLRGIAILLVMMQHMMVMVPSGAVPTAIFELAQVGWAGVDLFFVLSGFLITGILIDNRNSPRYFADFYKRRILRIFPLFYAVAIFSFLILPHLPFIPAHKLERFGTVGDDEILYWTFLSNIAIVNAGGIFRHGIMDVTWSLSIEEQFYLIWPFIIALSSRRIIPVCIGLIAISFALRIFALSQNWPSNSIYVFTPLRFDGLAAGAIVACAVRTWQEDPRLITWAQRALVIGAAGFLFCAWLDGTLAYYDSRHITAFGYSFLAIGYAGLLATAYLSKPGTVLPRILSLRVLRFIGKISFALYLFHLPIRAALRDLLITPEWIATTPLGGLTGQFLFYAVALVITCFAAWLSFELFEKHFLKMGRKKPDHQVGRQA